MDANPGLRRSFSFRKRTSGCSISASKNPATNGKVKPSVRAKR